MEAGATPGDWRQTLRANVAWVRADIAMACARVGRDPADVRLLAVTKYVGLEVVRELLAAGVTDLGESRVQQLVARAAACGPARFDWPADEQLMAAAPGAPRWHMIGHLQRNKVKALLPHARILHALDSVRLADALAGQAAELGATVAVFIELNVAGERSKTGAPPEALPALVAAVRRRPQLCLRGLMTMTPYDDDPERSRPFFARLRALLTELHTSGRVGADCRDLSMGMSQDYTVAVEEGATIVRVGSALFENLPTADPRATLP